MTTTKAKYRYMTFSYVSICLHSYVLTHNIYNIYYNLHDVANWKQELHSILPKTMCSCRLQYFPVFNFMFPLFFITSIIRITLYIQLLSLENLIKVLQDALHSTILPMWDSFSMLVASSSSFFFLTKAAFSSYFSSPYIHIHSYLLDQKDFIILPTIILLYIFTHICAYLLSYK